MSNCVTVGLSGTYILTSTPTNVAGLQPLTVNWAVPSGRPTTDWIGLFGVGAPNNAYAWWQYANGTASGSATVDAPSQPGQYEFRYLQSNNLVAARSEIITVGAAPYALNAGAVSAGSATVNWTVPSGRPSTDWIGLFAVGASNHTNVGWEYTGGAASGSFSLTAPTQAGLYEFRYLLQDGYNSAAASNSVLVGISATYTVTAMPASVNPLGTVVITWNAPVGSASNDWIGLFGVDSPNNASLWWQYTSGAATGSVLIAMPAQTGQYELRYFQNGGYTAVGRSGILTVTTTP
jgi:Ca-activated chloride channel family protein